MVARDPVLTVLGPTELHVEPGTEARVQVRVRNVGDIIDEYQVQVLGDAAGWTRVESRSPNFKPPMPGGTPTLNVDKLADEEFGLVFSPPADGTARAGLVVAGIRVFSGENDTGAVVEVHLHVGGITQLSVAIAPSEKKARWSARYRVTIQNRGNERARIELVGSDKKEELVITPAEKLMVVPGNGGTHETTVKVRTRSPRVSGRPEPHQFELRAKERLGGGRLPVPGSEPVASGGFVEKPVLGGKAPAAVLAMVVALGALLFALRPEPDDPGTPPPPEAPALAASTTSTSIELSWARFGPGAYGDAFRVAYFQNESLAGVAGVTEDIQQAQIAVAVDAAGAPLQRGTEYCFVLQVLVEDRPGRASDPACASLPTVDVPEVAVTATAGADEIMLTWTEIEGVDDYVLSYEGRKEPGVSPGVTVSGTPGEEVCASIIAVIGDDESEASRACATLPPPAPEPTTPPTTAGGGNGAGGGSGGGDDGPDEPVECQLEGSTVIFFLATTESGDTNQRLIQAIEAVKDLYDSDSDPDTDAERVEFGTTDNLGFPPARHGFTLGYIDGLPDAIAADTQAEYITDNIPPNVVAEATVGEECDS